MQTTDLPDLFSHNGRLILISVLQTGINHQSWLVLTC